MITNTVQFTIVVLFGAGIETGLETRKRLRPSMGNGGFA